MSSGSAAVLEESVIDGRYHVESVLGRGAMGTVYQVRDEVTGKSLALKRLHRTGSAHSGRVQSELRFRREFHTIAGLRHPGIVQVFDFGLDAGGLYYTMELLTGDDLRTIAPCDVRRTCGLMRQLASALALLHARRLLHRDLKARNVRCDATGRARLLDFGVLATIGVAGEVAGTLPSIPPEALRGLPLDGRSDLFGLGALTYWLLTKRHAYLARSLGDLERVWAIRVPPPSSFRDDVPPALDTLVMSLLSIDPAGRPQDAAEVVARFDAAAELEPDPTLEVARGWVQSSSLVGRRRELDAMTDRINFAIGGKGGVVIVDAPSGMGKTRLLREAGLQGQVSGAAVVRARARTSASEPYAVIRKLGADLVAAMPTEARAAVAERPLAARVIDALRASNPMLSTVPHDPGEARLRRQEDIHGWFLALSERKPLMLMIDDLQRCDEASAAVLAGLAHAAPEHRLLIVASQRSDEAVASPKPVRALRRRAKILELQGLDARGVEDLCVGLLGRADGVGALARWMHDVAGGSPLLCTELVRHLIDRGQISYEQGAWKIPMRFDDVELPAALGEALELRLQRLQPRARRLGELLSLVSGRFDVELCAALLRDAEPSEVFAALDQLFVEEVLLEGERGIEFRHDAMRESLRARINPRKRPAMHARVAQVLEAELDRSGVGEQHRVAEVGWHFIEAGQRMRGARLLEQAGLALFESQSFADAVGALETAVEVYEEAGENRKRILALRHALTRAGVLSDHRIVRRHAEATISGFADDAGLPIASALRRFVGRRLSLLLGLLFAMLRWLFTFKHRTRPVQALVDGVATMTYAASVRSLGFDMQPLQWLHERVEPMGAFPNRTPAAAARLVENFVFLARGYCSGVMANSAVVHRILAQDQLTPMSELDRTMGHGAADFMSASVLALEQNIDYRHYIQALRGLKMRFFEAGSHNVEAFFHRLRGQEEEAKKAISRAELMGIQLGNIWVFESQLAWMSAIAYSFSGDSLGMERTARRLRRMQDEGFRFAGFISLLEAEQARAKGRPDEALQRLDEALQACRDDALLHRQLLEAARIDTLLAKKEYARTVQEASRVLDPSFARASLLRPVRIRITASQVVAQAYHLGHTSAAPEVESLLEQATATQSPILVGLAHEAAAAVADAAGDEGLRRHHARKCAATFAQTGNPVLVARGQKLLAKAAPGEASADEDEDLEATVAVPHEQSAAGQSLTEGPVVEEDTEHTASVVFTHSGSDP